MTGENRTLVGWFTASRLNHSATATSGGSRENQTFITGLQHQGSPIELPTQYWSERGESNSVRLAGGQKPNQSATLAINGAESGSARQNRTGLAALPKQFIANNDWAEQNGSGSESRTRVAALRM